MGKVKGDGEQRVKPDQSLGRDVRSWLDGVESLGLLKTVEGADWDQEIGAITDINVKKNKYTLLFDKIKGYPEGFRVLTGSLLDSRRLFGTRSMSSTKLSATPPSEPSGDAMIVGL